MFISEWGEKDVILKFLLSLKMYTDNLAILCDLFHLPKWSLTFDVSEKEYIFFSFACENFETLSIVFYN